MVLSKVIDISKRPEEGDYKITKKFAWLPKKVEGYIIWLENYKIVFEYKVRKRDRYYASLRLEVKGVWGEWEIITLQRLK